MEFNFTEEQLMFRDSVYRYGKEQIAPLCEAADLKGEFARKARTLAGNFQLVRQLPALLDPRRNRIFVQLVSHKLLRLAGPYALATLLGSNLVLVATLAPPWPFYVATLAGQLGFYGLAAVEALTGRGGRLGRLGHTFVVLNLAAAAGLWRYLRGDLTWTRADAQGVSRPPPGPQASSLRPVPEV